jgi:DNA invertase Pin-like site-specific DNA recombinase
MLAIPINHGAPVAYVRRSVASRSDPGDVSREFQTDAVRRLAGEDATRLTIIDGDWGRSAATDKTNARLAFLGLVDAIERGEVSTVYAYSADRLARSVEWSARLLNACRRAGTTIVTGEGRFGPDDDAATDLFNFRAVVNESTLRQMERKAQASVESRRRRNLEAGLAPTEGMGRHALTDVAVVVDAFRVEGTLNGTAQRLNAANVPTWSSRNLHDPAKAASARWTPRTVARILRREGVIVKRGGRRGAPLVASHVLAGILRCPHPACVDQGRILTPRVRIARDGTITSTYYCRTAYLDSAHPHPSSSAESRILPWVKDEIARLRLDFDAVAMADSDAAERAALEARRDRATELYIAGRIDKARYDAEDAAVTKALGALPDPDEVVAVSPITDDEWSTWAPADLNRYIRSILLAVHLGPDMRPVDAIWRVPALRRG